MSENMTIQSHTGSYTVGFTKKIPPHFVDNPSTTTHILIDRIVAELHRSSLRDLLESSSVLMIDALEGNKSLEKMPIYVQGLIDAGVRRDHRLLAIGGGIIQDITCFLAATLLRGIDWAFFPTTLLAQADSCIGSKSSINCGDTKNILGTFTPPREVHICSFFLETLAIADVHSGVGEMLKVHAIDGPSAFDRIAEDYENLFTDEKTMDGYIHNSLLIKKGYIEKEEFDQGPRNIFTFGHSFGHAIESATEFGVPHGIAVTIGMDIALHVAHGMGRIDDEIVSRMRPVLRKNAGEYVTTTIPLEAFFTALSKDKKNVGKNSVTIILPDKSGHIERVVLPMDKRFRDLCSTYFSSFTN